MDNLWTMWITTNENLYYVKFWKMKGQKQVRLSFTLFVLCLFVMGLFSAGLCLHGLVYPKGN